MNNKSALFYKLNEPYAAGLFELPERSPFVRYSRASRRYFENCVLPPLGTGKLYPTDHKFQITYAVVPEYSYTVYVVEDALKEKNEQAAQWMEEELSSLAGFNTLHTIGGAGYTHSIPNYGRIVREGFSSYENRVNVLPDSDFKEGILDVLCGIRAYHSRILSLLNESNADSELITALNKVPFSPAETLYEALVCWNFIYYIDLCDNPGRLDADLIEFYRGEDVTDILREFFRNIDKNSGWTGALGPDCNELTTQCLKAIKGFRRPSLELRVTDKTSNVIWDLAAESIASGCGQPSLYNEELYQSSLSERFPYIPKEDLLRFCGGGCTETMLAGISNVGSLDAGINLLMVFHQCMTDNLACSASFDDFYDSFLEQARKTIADTLDTVNSFQKSRAEHRPNPVRSLLTDDCIDKGLDFNNGGARYYWSVINVAGLINVIDSLLSIKELVYDKKRYVPNTFLDLLSREDSGFFGVLKKCPCYGVDDEISDTLAADFAADIWNAFDQRKPWLGGMFLPSSIQFNTYLWSGKSVMVTPDGRRNGAPLCDSLAAIHGRDTKGPTAMLNSAARLHLNKATGTPVTNLRLSKEYIEKALRPLTLGYFNSGGMQLQITCVSREAMLDAQKNPEAHKNLIVRIGGYSEYFNRLDSELQQTVIDRTEHSV